MKKEESRSATIDSSHCPICGQQNQCTAQSSNCWCFDADISQDILNQIPAILKNKSCICPSCAQQSQSTESKEDSK